MKGSDLWSVEMWELKGTQLAMSLGSEMDPMSAMRSGRESVTTMEHRLETVLEPRWAQWALPLVLLKEHRMGRMSLAARTELKRHDSDE